jgi:hypothetical protein
VMFLLPGMSHELTVAAINMGFLCWRRLESCGWSCGVLRSMLVRRDSGCLQVGAVKAKDFDTSLLSRQTLANIDDVLREDVTFSPV